MPEHDLEMALRQALTEISGEDLSAIDLDTDLILKLGLDSLAGLRLLAALEKRFEVRFPDHHLGELRTLRQFLEHLNRPPEQTT